MNAPLSSSSSSISSISAWRAALSSQGYELLDFSSLPDPNRALDCDEEAAEQSKLDSPCAPERSLITEVVGDSIEVKVITGTKASGTGWRIWPASRFLTDCLLMNQCLLGKEAQVLEIGAGCGLASIALAKSLNGKMQKKIIASDYKEAIVARLTRAIQANSLNEGTISAMVLDWSKIPECFMKKLDILIGSDLVYSLEAADTLSEAIRRLLTPSGIFIGCFSHYRVGFTEFASHLHLNFDECAFWLPPRSLVQRLAKSKYSHWVMVMVSRPKEIKIG